MRARSCSGAGARRRPGTARATLGALAAIATLLAATPAAAHFRSHTISSVAIGERGVTWRIAIRLADIAEPVGLAKTAGVAEVRSHADRVGEYVAARLAVFDGGTVCEVAHARVDRDPDAAEPQVAVVVRFACPRTVAKPKLRYELFFDLDSLHQGFAQITLPGATTSQAAVFRADAREITLARDVPAWRYAADYAELGVEHIFTGYDHLAFLAGLLLPLACLGAAGRRPVRETLFIVTAFTLAHSVTLIAAALGSAVVRPAVVEPLIALSVAFVGVENLVRWRRGLEAARARWLVAGGFGLVHGLGFAGVLTEIGLPPKGAVISLLAFNLGVEAGQLVVVLLVLPLLLRAATRHGALYRRWGLGAGSAVIAALGGIWIVLRLL